MSIIKFTVCAVQKREKSSNSFGSVKRRDGIVNQFSKPDVLKPWHLTINNFRNLNDNDVIIEYSDGSVLNSKLVSDLGNDLGSAGRSRARKLFENTATTKSDCPYEN